MLILKFFIQTKDISTCNKIIKHVLSTEKMASLEDPDVSDFQAPVTCLDCEGHKNVNSYCVDCKGNICDKCKTRRLHKEHRIFPRTHRDAVKARRKAKQRCKKHTEKEYVTFCKKCSVPCCSDCIAKEHVNHAFINIEDAAKDAMADIKTYMGKLETDVLPSIEKVHCDLELGLEKYNKSLQKVKDDSKDRFRMLRNDIDRAERDWMQQLNAITKADHVEMDRLQNEVQEKIKQTKSLIATCKTVVTESGELDLLLFKHKFQDKDDLKPNTVSMPAVVKFLPSTYRIPKTSDLVGCIEKENIIIGVETSQSRASAKGDTLPFSLSMVQVTPVKTHSVQSNTVLHTTDDVWINNRGTEDLTLYNENFDCIKTVHLGFQICDMALEPTNDIIASDENNKRLIRISRSGDVTKLCSTGKLLPWGLCINDKQQIVVGLRRGLEKQPIKLAVYSPDGSVLLQEIEKDKSGKPLFTTGIFQVKQNGNGEYIVADGDRIVCVSREGEYKWMYQVKKIKGYAPYVYGIVCDSYDNIIIADQMNDQISLLDSKGKLIRTLLTIRDGISEPLSLAIDRQGHLWIGQSVNVKVIKTKRRRSDSVL